VPQGWTFVDLGEVPEKMFNARLRSHIVLSFKEDAIGIRLPPSLPRLRGRVRVGDRAPKVITTVIAILRSTRFTAVAVAAAA
jgi:hypothetical protein